MNSFRVVLSLAIIFIIGVAANSTKGYLFFYRNIDVLLLVSSVAFLLFVLAVSIFRKAKSRASI